jgi:hypothetical protein
VARLIVDPLRKEGRHEGGRHEGGRHIEGGEGGTRASMAVRRYAAHHHCSPLLTWAHHANPCAPTQVTCLWTRLRSLRTSGHARSLGERCEHLRGIAHTTRHARATCFGRCLVADLCFACCCQRPMVGGRRPSATAASAAAAAAAAAAAPAAAAAESEALSRPAAVATLLSKGRVPRSRLLLLRALQQRKSASAAPSEGRE